MSKKKQYVIDAERQNFVYGNEEQGIKAVSQMGSVSRQQTRSTIPWLILQNMRSINHMQPLMQWLPIRRHI